MLVFTATAWFFLNRTTSLANFHDTKHPITHISLDLSKGRLLTCGSDTVVKVSLILFIVHHTIYWNVLDTICGSYSNDLDSDVMAQTS